MPTCQLGLQQNILWRWITGIRGNSQQPWSAARPTGSSPFLLSSMERRVSGKDNRLPDRLSCSRKVSAVTTPTLPHNDTELKVPACSDPVKCWNFRKDDWKRFCFLTRKSGKRLPPAETTNIEKAYQELWKSLLFAAEQCIPLIRCKNYVPCWDKECETLYRSFLRAPVGTDSDRAAFSPLKDKKHERWEEAVNSIDFSHSSRKEWSTINKLWKATSTRIVIFKWGAIVWQVSWLTTVFILFLVNPLSKSSSIPWFSQRITPSSSIYTSDFLTNRWYAVAWSFVFNVDFVVTILILTSLLNMKVSTGGCSWLSTVFIMMSLDWCNPIAP